MSPAGRTPARKRVVEAGGEKVREDVVQMVKMIDQLTFSPVFSQIMNRELVRDRVVSLSVCFIFPLLLILIYHCILVELGR